MFLAKNQPNKKPPHHGLFKPFFRRLDGADDAIRTRDLILTKDIRT